MLRWMVSILRFMVSILGEGTKSKMRELQRHNFEFIRTEILHISVEDFADKIGVSKSSYQRMKSDKYNTAYCFSPIQKACELADISLDLFSKQFLTKELYKKRHKKTRAIVLSKKQLLAFFVFGVILAFLSFGVVAKEKIHNDQVFSTNILPEVKSSVVYESEGIYYWTDKEGGSYHANRNCPIIKSRSNIESGTPNDAQKKKKYDPCDFCVVQ